MESQLAQAFLAIMGQINKNVPEIKFIDEDYGQLTQFDGRQGVGFPAVLIDFPQINYSDLGGLAQDGLGTVQITLAYPQVVHTSNIITAPMRERGLAYYEIEHKLNSWLHGFSPGDAFGMMTRQGAVGINTPMAIKLRRITYRLGMEDCSASPVYTLVPLPPGCVDY